ncbi:hypothetical protein BY996DRAFT_6527106 [Phakopsora pachyrhizi]|nr:hypothetical protein BY996DRAFT_6527106 [Phakopsora pachyrhizi]
MVHWVTSILVAGKTEKYIGNKIVKAIHGKMEVHTVPTGRRLPNIEAGIWGASVGGKPVTHLMREQEYPETTSFYVLGDFFHKIVRNGYRGEVNWIREVKAPKPEKRKLWGLGHQESKGQKIQSDKRGMGLSSRWDLQPMCRSNPGALGCKARTNHWDVFGGPPARQPNLDEVNQIEEEEGH